MDSTANNDVLLAMMRQFVWPMKINETYSQSTGRWVIRDSNNKQFGVLYDVDKAQALAITAGLNLFNIRMIRDVAPIAELADTPKQAFEQPSWPAWAGKYPRHGAVWSVEEINMLCSMWSASEPIFTIAKVLGRDPFDVYKELDKVLGWDFEAERADKIDKENRRLHAIDMHNQKVQKAFTDLLVLVGMDINNLVNGSGC
jgi:hypothetical protein